MTKQEAWHELNLFVNLKSAPLISRLNEALDALKPPPDEPHNLSIHERIIKLEASIRFLTSNTDDRFHNLEDQLATHRMAEHHTHEERITPKFVVPKPHDDRPYPYNQIYKQAR